MSLRTTALFLLILPVGLSAQVRLHSRPDTTAILAWQSQAIVGPVPASASASRQAVVIDDSSRRGTVRVDALRGAALGGAVGLIMGITTSRSIGCGCSDNARLIGIPLFEAMEGVVIGAGVGAVVGWIRSPH